MTDGRVSDEAARGTRVGRHLARPGMFDHGVKLQVAGPVIRAAFEAGLTAGQAQPPLQEPEEFYRGFLQGLRETDEDFRAAHSRTALCDPDEPAAMCEYCRRYRDAMRVSWQDRRWWEAQTQDPARAYAAVGSARIHTRDCPAILREAAAADERVTTLTPADAWHGGETVQWPQLLTRAEAMSLNRTRCRTCAPDLPERVPRTSVRLGG